MNDKEKFTEEESLRLIAKMINQAKNYYYESGLGALLWGITNLVCFVLAYLDAAVKGFHLPFNPFFLMIITFLLQLYYDKKEKKFQRASSFMDEAIRYVWLTFGIAVLILTIGGGFADIGYIVLPMLLLLFGIPTFITGCIKKFPPFVIGGIVCWICCIVALFYKSYITYLLVAASATFAWIIPGIILRVRFNRNRLKTENGV